MTCLIERQLCLKVKAAWKQLDTLRISRIIRIIVWNDKQRFLGTPEKIKKDYGALSWSFSEELTNNAENYKKRFTYKLKP